MSRIIDYWKVEYEYINSARILPALFECIAEPERIVDYYRLDIVDGETIHVLSKNLSYISWKPIYKDD